MSTNKGIQVKDTPDADQLKIVPRTVAEIVGPVGGALPEPEEMPAARVLKLENQLTGNLTGPALALGELPLTVKVERNVATFANGYRSMCGDCAHFRAEDWRKLKRLWETARDEARQIMLNHMRYMLDGKTEDEVRERHQTLDGDFDVEAALMAAGICDVLTMMSDDPPVIVWPQGACPAEFVFKNGTKVPFPMSFASKDSATDRRINETYDAIMRTAAGEK